MSKKGKDSMPFSGPGGPADHGGLRGGYPRVDSSPSLRTESEVLSFIEETVHLLNQGTISPRVAQMRLTAAREARQVLDERNAARLTAIERKLKEKHRG